MDEIRKIELFELVGEGEYSELVNQSYIDESYIEYGNKQYSITIDSIAGYEETSVTKTVYVAVDGDLEKNTFYITNDNNWITVIRTRNKVVIKFKNNYETSERVGNIYFFHRAIPNVYALLTITQRNHIYSISISAISDDSSGNSSFTSIENCDIAYVKNSVDISNIYSLKSKVIYFDDEYPPVKKQITNDEYNELTYNATDFKIHTYINEDGDIITQDMYNGLATEEEKNEYVARYIFSDNNDNEIISKSEYDNKSDEEQIKYMCYEFKYINTDIIIDYEIYYSSNAQYRFENYSYIKKVNGLNEDESPINGIPEFGRQSYVIDSYIHKQSETTFFQEDYEPLIYFDPSHVFVQISYEEFLELSPGERYLYEVLNYKLIDVDTEDENCVVITSDEYLKLPEHKYIDVQEYENLSADKQQSYEVYQLRCVATNELIDRDNFISEVPIGKKDYYIVGTMLTTREITYEEYMALNMDLKQDYDLRYFLIPYFITDNSHKKQNVIFKINCGGGSENYRIKTKKFIKQGGLTLEDDITIDEEYREIPFSADFNVSKKLNKVIVENFGNVNSAYYYHYVKYTHTITQNEYDAISNIAVRNRYTSNNDGTYTCSLRAEEYTDSNHIYEYDKYIKEERLVSLSELPDMTPEERFYVDDEHLILMNDLYYIIKIMHYDVVGVYETIRLSYDYDTSEIDDQIITVLLPTAQDTTDIPSTDIDFDTLPDNEGDSEGDSDDSEGETEIIPPYIEIPTDSYVVPSTMTTLIVNVYAREGDGLYLKTTNNFFSNITIQYVENDLYNIVFKIGRNKFTSQRSCAVTVYNGNDITQTKMFTIIQNGKQ